MENEKIIKVAIVQFARDRLNPNKNILRMKSLIKKIKNIDFALLPEAWLGATFVEEKSFTDVLNDFCSIAKKNNINIITGGVFIKIKNKIFDRCHIISKSGKIIGKYDKRFPSKSVGEREFMSAGKTDGYFKINEFKIGVMICVDIMYPELARNLALRNVSIIFVPSNIIKSRIDLWKSVSIARASENTVFVIFSNNTKTKYLDGREVSGNSSVISPDGRILFSADEEENIYYFDIDLNEIANVRKRWPYLEDAKFLLKKNVQK